MLASMNNGVVFGFYDMFTVHTICDALRVFLSHRYQYTGKREKFVTRGISMATHCRVASRRVESFLPFDQTYTEHCVWIAHYCCALIFYEKIYCIAVQPMRQYITRYVILLFLVLNFFFFWKNIVSKLFS